MPQASLPPTGASVSVLPLTFQVYVAEGPSLQHHAPAVSRRSVLCSTPNVTVPSTRNVVAFGVQSETNSFPPPVLSLNRQGDVSHGKTSKIQRRSKVSR